MADFFWLYGCPMGSGRADFVDGYARQGARGSLLWTYVDKLPIRQWRFEAEGVSPLHFVKERTSSSSSTTRPNAVRGSTSRWGSRGGTRPTSSG